MEATLNVVIQRLQSIKEKTYESISAELSRIEDEFDREITKSEQTIFDSGLFRFNWDLKQKHQSIVTSILPAVEIKEEVIPEVIVEEPIITEPEPIVETVEVEIESSIVKPKASKAKIVDTTEP